jgi:hypothetical protein
MSEATITVSQSCHFQVLATRLFRDGSHLGSDVMYRRFGGYLCLCFQDWECKQNIVLNGAQSLDFTVSQPRGSLCRFVGEMGTRKAVLGLYLRKRILRMELVACYDDVTICAIVW